jgi:transcriptional regulator with XRE-family HTH domain
VKNKTQNKPARKKVTSPFGQNLKAVMQRQNLTQRKVAEICGVSVSVVNDWLAGSQPHDLGVVLKLCNEFNLDFKWLLTGQKSSIASLKLEDIFHIEDDPSFSGLFLLEAKRLKKK